MVTCQVLNEGVDVPAANVGIILSGTGSVREHVQRLGRLLRKHGDKQALLYEVVTRGTAEEFTSDRGGSTMRSANSRMLGIPIDALHLGASDIYVGWPGRLSRVGGVAADPHCPKMSPPEKEP